MDIAPFARSPVVSDFGRSRIRHASGTDEPARVATEAVLKMPAGEVGEAGAARLPVCRHPPMALDNALLGKVPLAPWLTPLPSSTRNSTGRFAGAETQGESFLDGHAHATIVGTEGPEIRRDISLMAPRRQGQ
jgi:hypothetical protein